MAEALPAYKTYKNFVGGGYERSESGRTRPYLWQGRETRLPLSSRKDFRNAVEAARKAQPGWCAKTAYNRGQILYRTAEMLESRRGEFASYLPAGQSVDQVIERITYISGWADKFSQVLSSVNEVNGPYYVSTAPEPIGTTALIVPSNIPFLATVTRLLLSAAVGNSVVCLVDGPAFAELSFGEVLQTSDWPGGTINILAGSFEELAPVMASHKDVTLLDMPKTLPESIGSEIASQMTSNLKKLSYYLPDAPAPSPGDIAALCESKTVWHPLGY